ncbi:MAG: hypothetical protein ACK5PR_01790 [bacterium]
MNITGAKRRIGYKGDLRVPYAFAGWNDALHNRPFNYSMVDSAPSSYLAIAYESARLRVLALRMAGIPVPKWNTPSSVPPRVHGAFSQATELNKAARIHGTIIFPIGAKGWQPIA